MTENSAFLDTGSKCYKYLYTAATLVRRVCSPVDLTVASSCTSLYILYLILYLETSQTTYTARSTLLKPACGYS